jgi:IPT/TIG domain-containing protein
MADFSRPPEQDLGKALREGYIGIYFEQGVPILDRDLNLLQSLVAENVRSIVRSYIGDGVPAGGSGFAIKPVDFDNDFAIAAGKCLVDGIEVNLAEDLRYSKQKPAQPALRTPSSGTRVDTVYLDVTLETVEGGPGDRDLLNQADVGVQTSVRVKRSWAVRVAEGQPPPEPATGHAHHPLARLTRPAGQARVKQEMIADLRHTGVSLDEVESRMSRMEELRARPMLRPDMEFDPDFGNAGDGVRIFGRNLDLFPVEVFFDDVKAPTPATVESNMIAVAVPAAHGGGDAVIRVVTGEGAERRTVESVRKFSVLTGDPTIKPPPDDLRPPTAAQGATVTVEGTNLNVGEVKVRFGTIEVPDEDIVEKKPTQLRVKVPGGLTDPVPVTVETAGGSATTVTKFAIMLRPVFDAQPFDTDPVAAGASLTMKGRHFTGVTRVRFRRRLGQVVPVAPGDFEVRDDRTIKTTVPSAAAGPCTVIVTGPAGDGTSPELTVLSED